MKFDTAIDRYIQDMQAQGRLTSPSSERGYRSTLRAHAEDVQNRDPAYTGREDVKRTLRRWPQPNTQGTNRSKLVSFYAWAIAPSTSPFREIVRRSEAHWLCVQASRPAAA